MKKSIYFSGIACTFLMLLGCMFKVMHWPGASVMLILSVFLFCFLFLPSALVSNYKTQEGKYKALHAVTFVVFALCMMGVLFKVMHWPGASLFLFIGLPLPFILFMPVYLYQTKDQKKGSSTNFLGIMFGLTFLAVFSVLLSLNVSKQILARAAAITNDNEQMANFTSSVSGDRGTGTKVKVSSDELYAYIDELKCELISAGNPGLCTGKKPGPGYDAKQLADMDNQEFPKYILLGSGENNAGKLPGLKAKIAAYREALTSSGKLSPELEQLAKDLFDVGDKEIRDENGEMVSNSWEQIQFPSYRLIFVIDLLSQIQANARLVESEFLASAK
ncbi:MAG: GldL-related protein [Bacteroidia bacterium]